MISTRFARGLARQKVEVVEHLDGRLTVRSGAASLAFTTILPAPFMRHAAPDATGALDSVDSKHLTPVLAALREQQAVPAAMRAAGG